MKSLKNLILLLIICFTFVINPIMIVEAENIVNHGITVSEDGKLLLMQNRVHLIGVNTFSLFIDLLNGVKTEEDVDRDLALLSTYEVPFIRIPFCTWDTVSYQKYETDKNGFFEKMDIIVNKAEEKKIGLIIDFFWNDSTVFYYKNEQRSDMGNANSNSIDFSKRYVMDIVNRYKNRHAIWGYEIGNEYSLSVDLYPSNSVQVAPNFSITNGSYNNKDFFTTNELTVFYTEISNAIRSVDPDRIIINGDSSERAGAYSLYNQTKEIAFNNHTSWENDFTASTRDQYKEIIKKRAPAAIDTISFHLYEYDLEQVGSFGDYIRVYIEAANEAHKALYLGEFSGNDTRGDNEANFNKVTFDNEINAISNCQDLQLSSVWMFSRTGNNEGSYIISDDNEKDRYRLEKIKEYNNQSKEVLNDYWLVNVLSQEQEQTTDVTEEDISVICKPYITYSTKTITTGSVLAKLDFENDECIAKNKSEVVFEKNGEYIFQYTKDGNNQVGAITAKVNWIEEIENPQTGSLLSKVIISIILLSSIVIYIYINNKMIKNNMID